MSRDKVELLPHVARMPSANAVCYFAFWYRPSDRLSVMLRYRWETITN